MKNWMTSTLPCVGLGDVFFPEEETPMTVLDAKSICSICQFRMPCLDASLYEDFGVWSGMASWERKPFRYKLTRAFNEIMPQVEPAAKSVACILNESMSCILE